MARRRSHRPFVPHSVVDVALPGLEFLLEVRAVGWKPARVGPFAVASAPERVEVELVPGPAIRGKVTAQGAPIAGARVSLRHTQPGGGVYRAYDWKGSGEPFEYTSKQVSHEGAWMSPTDAAGRFVLPIEALKAVPSGAAVILHAEADGFAPADLGPLAISPERGAADLVIELAAGGGLAGEVLAPEGLELEGSFVHASDGGGVERSRVLDATGAFRFDDLQPGAWQVTWLSQRERFLNPRLYPVPSASRRADCHVAAGETSTHVIDLRARRPATLEGRLSVAGEDAGGWSVRVWRIDADFDAPLLLNQDGSPRVDEGRLNIRYRDETSGLLGVAPVRPEGESALDVDGRFRIPLPESGEHWIVLTNEDGLFPGTVVYDRVQVGPGPTPWERSVAWGTIGGTCSAEHDGEAHSRLYHRWKGPGAFFVQTAIVVRLDGELRATRVAAGAGRIHGATRPSGAGYAPDLAQVLAEVEVVAGERLEIDIP